MLDQALGMLREELTISDEGSKEVISIECRAIPMRIIELLLATDDGLTSPHRETQEGGVVFPALLLLELSDGVVLSEGGAGRASVVDGSLSLTAASDSNGPAPNTTELAGLNE